VQPNTDALSQTLEVLSLAATTGRACRAPESKPLRAEPASRLWLALPSRRPRPLAPSLSRRRRRRHPRSNIRRLGLSRTLGHGTRKKRPRSVSELPRSRKPRERSNAPSQRRPAPAPSGNDASANWMRRRKRSRSSNRLAVVARGSVARGSWLGTRDSGTRDSGLAERASSTAFHSGVVQAFRPALL